MGKTVIVHTDGLGWKRKKWSGIIRRLYKATEWLSARSASALITDNPEMKVYYQREYGANSTIISYGAFNNFGTDSTSLNRWGVLWKKYYLVVARLEPENNTDLIIKEYVHSRATFPLLIVGDSPYDPGYMKHLRAISNPDVRFLGRIDNQTMLNTLYQGAFLYIHGHEVGGTNPSLLRAMGQATAPLVLDVSFNKAVIGNSGYVFSREEGDLAEKLERSEKTSGEVANVGISARLRAEALFTWESVTSEHERLFLNVLEAKRK
jgi:glycosyltransferase involved in cell wall biosynthesis